MIRFYGKDKFGHWVSNPLGKGRFYKRHDGQRKILTEKEKAILYAIWDNTKKNFYDFDVSLCDIYNALPDFVDSDNEADDLIDNFIRLGYIQSQAVFSDGSETFVVLGPNTYHDGYFVPQIGSDILDYKKLSLNMFNADERWVRYFQ